MLNVNEDLDIREEFKNAPKVVLLNSLAEAYELIKKQNQLIQNYSTGNLSGIMFSEEAKKELDIIFPGGVMDSTEEVIGVFSNGFSDVLKHGISMIEEPAMSGCMRWPWSSEAKVYIDFNDTLRHL